MLFDTWGGLLPPAAYRRFSLDPMRGDRSTALAATSVPTIVFTQARRQCAARDRRNRAHRASGLDWTVDLARRARAVGARVALQGNLDPLVLLTDAATVAREATAVVRAAGPAPGHVFNLGHGIVPRRRRRTSRRWSRPCTTPRAKAACRMPSHGATPPNGAIARGLTNRESAVTRATYAHEPAISSYAGRCDENCCERRFDNQLKKRGYFRSRRMVQQSSHELPRPRRRGLVQLRTTLSTDRWEIISGRMHGISLLSYEIACSALRLRGKRRARAQPAAW